MARRKCRKGKRGWDTYGAAAAALRYIYDNPDPARLYVPTMVEPRCACGQYHLTSKPAKPYAKGKKSRRTPPLRRR